MLAEKIRTHTVSAIFRATAITLALLMLVSLPAVRSHNFATHLRTPTTRRSTLRHTSVAQPEMSAGEQVQSHPSPLALIPVEAAATVIRPVLGLDSRTNIPLARMLRRLKLGFSRARSPDPLA